MMKLDLDCFSQLRASEAALAHQVTQMGAAYASIKSALEGADADIADEIETTAAEIATAIAQIEAQTEEAIGLIETWFGDLRADLEAIIVDSIGAGVDQINLFIDAAADELKEQAGNWRRAADQAASDLVQSASSQIEAVRQAAEERFAERCEAEIAQFCQDVIGGLISSTTIDVAVSQISAALSGSISAALPYLIPAKAAVGAIRRAVELVR